MSKEPKLNQIVFIDLGFRGKPYAIIKITKLEKEGKIFFSLYLLPITSEEDEEIKEEQKPFISQYKIRLLPNCMEIDPSFVRIHNYVDLVNIEKSELTRFLCSKCSQGCFKWLEDKNQNEYEFIVKKHIDYRNDKLNALKLLPPFKIDWSKSKKTYPRRGFKKSV
ncbi:MAG: hypothetical protein I3270_01740 [Candidatus Moeniiplasma glomeromycotorum]|nr:hypothetical protein [Candidatus Moeniiplasma glomeromycotorum]MCE8162429.1 hypothetical protein [Candidatus Moeniiplasma glomeromycotorum]MCE8166355.1 hypothetical protein [Candidatus Moeniiplasma glomeromycotorum]MCE8166837.1 hypothetical protein [Candidatus Moeniiplasma glomeromycotorum]